MFSTDFVAVSAFCVVAVCFLVNMVSQGVKFKPPVPASTAHPAGEDGGIVWNPWHFVIVVLMLLAWTVITLETPYVKNIYQNFRPGVASTAPAIPPTPPPATPPGTAPIPDPVNFTFDPAKGELKAPAPPAQGIPSGYVLVAKYVSAMSPLTGTHQANGVVLDTTLRLPKDATSIELQLWNKSTNVVTGWAPVP